jgi:hypothetical protein
MNLQRMIEVANLMIDINKNNKNCKNCNKEYCLGVEAYCVVHKCKKNIKKEMIDSCLLNNFKHHKFKKIEEV